MESCSVLIGTETADGRVQPAGVVPTLDVVEDGTVESGSDRPRPGVDELAFDCGEEGFATALSQHSPFRPIESTTPLLRAISAKSRLVY